MSSSIERLKNKVLSRSRSKIWEEAVKEWDITDCEEDESLESECVCGQEGLRYLYTIRNRETGLCLFPIGSRCIKRFEREDLNEEISVREKMYKLLHAAADRKFIELNSEFFSRKLLLKLYDEGAFVPSEYNDYNAYNDYLFLRNCFNARSISPKQEAKARAVIAGQILPYLRKTLKIREKKGMTS